MKAPRSIGDYRVITLIGVGGSASVYRAVRANDDVQVAIKVLADNHSAMAESRRRFTEEWRLLARVDHPSIATVYDAGETEDGQPYMVLELANRGDLRTRVGDLTERGYQIDGADVLVLADHLRESLSALHAGEVVHRDISPSNILIRGNSNGRPPLSLDRSLLEPGERLLLSDLGFAKRLADSSGLTRGGGTERFAAPEQRAAVSIVDQRADVFSATALIGWLVTGTPTADRLADFIATGTAEDPEDRHADIEAWHQDLEQSLRASATSLPGEAGWGGDQDAEVTSGIGDDGGKRRVVSRAFGSVPDPRGPAGMVAVVVILAIATAAALLVWPASTTDTSTADGESAAVGDGGEGPDGATSAVDQGSSATGSPSGVEAGEDNSDRTDSPGTTVAEAIDSDTDTASGSDTATDGSSNTGPSTTDSAPVDSSTTGPSTTGVNTTEPSSTAATTTPPSTATSTTVNQFPFSPRAYLGAPADGAVVDGNLVVSGTAESPDGVASVLLVIHDEQTGDYWHDDPGAFQDDFIRFPVPVAETGATETTWTYTVAAANLSAGTYRIRVWARSVDGFGDPVSDTRTITISN